MRLIYIRLRTPVIYIYTCRRTAADFASARFPTCRGHDCLVSQTNWSMVAHDKIQNGCVSICNSIDASSFVMSIVSLIARIPSTSGTSIVPYRMRLEAVCDTSIAPGTGCIWPHGGFIGRSPWVVLCDQGTDRTTPSE